MQEAVDHFKAWVRKSTGCMFAARLVRDGRVAYEPHEEVPDVDDLDTRLEVYGASARSVIILLPFVASEVALVDVLNTLTTGSPRWRVRDRGRTPAGCGLVGLEWTTADGDVSDAMGFAPLPSMPVTRRAPYFAIALWCGGRHNLERGAPPTPRPRSGQVSFLDADHAVEHDAYVKLWTETEKTVAGLMLAPPDSASLYRKVAFALSPRAEDALNVAPRD